MQYRKTDYLEYVARAVVSHMFVKYGERPLTELLGDLGVSREVVMAEIDAYAIPVIDVLREEGYVEALVRRRLTPFYKSAAARKILHQEA